MNDIFVNLLFGHLVGDYILQSKSIAVKKSASNGVATLHVAIYTLAVLLFTFPFHNFHLGQYYLWVAAIFVPHYLIDRYSLADKWLKLINGRSLEDFFENGRKDIPISQYANDADNKRDNYHILRGGFTTLVYTVTDNTFHLICLWYGYKIIFT